MYCGTDLLNLREQQRLTRKALAERSGISRSTLGRLEAGRSVPTIEMLVKLANSMDLPLAKLFVKLGILHR
jgi:XRE family transcriptional regulator, regulator of sulfur utilization